MPENISVFPVEWSLSSVVSQFVYAPRLTIMEYFLYSIQLQIIPYGWSPERFVAANRRRVLVAPLWTELRRWLAATKRSGDLNASFYAFFILHFECPYNHQRIS